MKIKNEVLRENRLRKGYSQEYLADILGVSQSQFSKLENGEVYFRINELSKIIELLEINPLELIDFNEKEQVFINSSFSGNINTNINGFDEELVRKIIKEEIIKNK